MINGADLVRRFRNEIEYLDFARILEKVAAAGASRESLRRHHRAAAGSLEARAVILATGADAVRLDVPGADRYFLNGVAYSTVSYAPLYIDKTVALVGAGAMALRGAAELAQIAKQLYWIAPTHGELDTPLGRRLQAAEHVTLLENWEPVAVEGDTMPRRLVVARSARSRCGRRARSMWTRSSSSWACKPHTELVRGLGRAGSTRGAWWSTAAAETSVPGLFAAGDVTHLPAEQVLIAIGEGAKAALNAYEYLLKCEEC